MTGAKVLVVEDEPDLRGTFRAFLHDAGYQVIEAADGAEAYRLFEEERPRAVILDLRVPVISGFRLLELFRQEAPHLPIIVITALAFEEAEEVAHHRPDGFITKPFDFNELIDQLARLLDKP